MVSNQFFPIREISIDGFQVVSSAMFERVTKTKEPTCTFWWNSISFSKPAVEALNNCERIRIEVNTAKRCILIIPVTATDRDGIRWVKSSKQVMVPRKMDCLQFTTPLFEAWGWDKEFVYRATGQLVSVEKKVMLLFNFSEPENWRMKEQWKQKG